ncbi:HNH endonuclease [Reyranella sp.]|uniref:HNH endonuclease n=1 Tax=Reyranella sp. TaxID=1929291 RepID=UPI003D1126BB
MDVPTGFPEGGLTRVQVNRYERDRRNRAAALAIHGLRCQGCETELTSIYGDAAAGFIEVHHITPVSKLGPGYSVDPKCDLVPLCPNCHGVIHRREPPIGVEELRQLIASNSSGASRSK